MRGPSWPRWNQGEILAMKTCAMMFTVGWAAALAFGWLALAAPQGEPVSLQMTNILLAATGAAAGLWSWLRIRRGC